MTIDLKAIRERATRATRGPLSVDVDDLRPDDGGLIVATVREPDGCILAEINPERLMRRGPGHDEDDAEFFAHARQDVPDLLRVVEIQTAALLEAEWGGEALTAYGENDGAACPSCHARREPRGRDKKRWHRPICALDAGLNAAGYDTREKRDAERERLRKERSE